MKCSIMLHFIWVFTVFKSTCLRVSRIQSFKSYFTENCAFGEFFDQETKSCRPCPIGTYENSTGSEECTPCDAGTTTRFEGTTTPNDCGLGKIILWLNSSKLCSNDILFSSNKRTLCIIFFIILCAVFKTVLISILTLGILMDSSCWFVTINLGSCIVHI